MHWLRRPAETRAFDFHGLSIRDFTAAGGPGSASIAAIRVNPGACHARAKSRRSDKLYIGFEGSVRFEVDGQTVALERGEVLIIPKETWFSYANESGEAARLLLVHVPPFDLADEVFEPAATGPQEQR